MSKYCSKCGAEITEGSKFCKNCGAPVENTQATAANQKTQKKVNSQKKGKKTPVIIGIIAVVVLIFAGLGIKNMGIGVADYEKPLKYQVDGINKNSVKTYKKAFVNGESYYSDASLKEQLKEVKKVSYKIESVDNISAMGLLNSINVLGIQSKDIEDAKELEVEFEIKDAEGDKRTATIDFDVVKLGGKWYALMDLLD